MFKLDVDVLIFCWKLVIIRYSFWISCRSLELCFLKRLSRYNSLLTFLVYLMRCTSCTTRTSRTSWKGTLSTTRLSNSNFSKKGKILKSTLVKCFIFFHLVFVLQDKYILSGLVFLSFVAIEGAVVAVIPDPDTQKVCDRVCFGIAVCCFLCIHIVALILAVKKVITDYINFILND